MSTNGMLDHVATQIGLITVPLYETVAAGVAEAQSRLQGFPDLDDHPYLLPTVARASINSQLKKHSPAGWELGGNPRRMGHTTLVSHQHNIELRLLKEHGRVHPGGVPPAGAGQARRDYYDNDELALMPVRDLLPGTFDPQSGIRLLWLWDRAIDNDEARISVRVVHPLNAAHFGKAVPLDYSFEIRPDGEMFSRLYFAGEEQNEQFFPNIDQKDNGTDGLAK